MDDKFNFKVLKVILAPTDDVLAVSRCSGSAITGRLFAEMMAMSRNRAMEWYVFFDCSLERNLKNKFCKVCVDVVNMLTI